MLRYLTLRTTEIRVADPSNHIHTCFGLRNRLLPPQGAVGRKTHSLEDVCNSYHWLRDGSLKGAGWIAATVARDMLKVRGLLSVCATPMWTDSLPARETQESAPFIAIQLQRFGNRYLLPTGHPTFGA
jgi:hypothetical protein